MVGRNRVRWEGLEGQSTLGRVKGQWGGLVDGGEGPRVLERVGGQWGGSKSGDTSDSMLSVTWYSISALLCYIT